MTRPFNKKFYTSPDEELPEDKYMVRINEKYGCITVTANPVWLKLIVDSRLVQHAHCVCDCGKTFFRTAYRIKNESRDNCNHQPKKIPATGKRHKGSFLVEGFKTCSTCLKSLPEECYTNANSRPDKKCGRCKNCSYFSFVKTKYGIDILKVIDMSKNIHCEICNRVLLLPNSNKPPCEQINIDHNHSSGLYRGILCLYCNCALGHVKENENVLSNMINYINLKETE